MRYKAAGSHSHSRRDGIRDKRSLIPVLVSVSFAAGFAAPGLAARDTEPSWNPKTAAAYLDSRAAWWTQWPAAARDGGTVCISCHTALPYMLARPALRNALRETEASLSERRILQSVIQRVRQWNEVSPFYSEQAGAGKAHQSRGTESVLNALILATAARRDNNLGDDARSAFRNMWALQDSSGAGRGSWAWLDFGNEPFEGADSNFYGACLAAVAVGTAPEDLRSSVSEQDSFGWLREYLDSAFPRQPLMNQAILLWAAAKLPGLLTPAQRASIANALTDRQQADGGWSLSSLSWTWTGSSPKSLFKLWFRSEERILEGKSDGYATGMVAFALEQSSSPEQVPRVRRALDWLRRNQSREDGRWPGYSLNHRPEGSATTELFMSDAATAYAVLALTSDAGGGFVKANR